MVCFETFAFGLNINPRYKIRLKSAIKGHNELSVSNRQFRVCGCPSDVNVSISAGTVSPVLTNIDQINQRCIIDK